MSNNWRKEMAGLWSSPAVRATRLGGLCVVAAVGLVAAGGLVARRPTPEAVWLGVCLLVLPGLALASLALHRAIRVSRG